MHIDKLLNHYNENDIGMKSLTDENIIQGIMDKLVDDNKKSK